MPAGIETISLQKVKEALVDEKTVKIDFAWKEFVCRNPHFMDQDGMARHACGGLLLGSTLTAGLLGLLFVPGSVRVFSAFVFCLSLFHLLEYFLTAMFRPRELSFNSFLLNHSRAFNYALLAGTAEFWLESLLFGGLKWRVVSLLGFLLVLLSQAVRSLAMWTAGSNFHHLVQSHKDENHTLVTHGIYRLMRHPSYTGFFLWSVGTQMLLCNPICLIGYIVVSYKFFEERILEEELFLFTFFGTDYVKYHQEVWSGLPFLTTPSMRPPSAQDDYSKRTQHDHHDAGHDHYHDAHLDDVHDDDGHDDDAHDDDPVHDDTDTHDDAQ